MFNRFKSKLFKNKDNIIDNNVIEAIKLITNTPIKTVIDIGAHHGRYSEAIVKAIDDVSIYMFEPFPNSFEHLKKNNLLAKHKMYEMAISNFNGKSIFYSNVSDETNSLLPSIETHSHIDVLTENKSIIEVEVITLDTFCANNNIDIVDVLKIDVQGNTLNVLKGASKFLSQGSINVIQSEVEFLPIYKDQSLYHHVTGYLEEFGYTLYSIYNLHYDINNRLSWADALYYKNK